jgi:hypothetical protein
MKKLNRNDEILREYRTIILGIVIIIIFLNAFILPKFPFLIYWVVNIFLITLFIYYLYNYMAIMYRYRS